MYKICHPRQLVDMILTVFNFLLKNLNLKMFKPNVIILILHKEKVDRSTYKIINC